MPASAFAQANNCMTDVSGVSGCTANDVSVAAVTGVTVIRGGTGDKCFEGGTFDFVANFTIQTTSNKTRSNIGLFFGTNGVSALTGTCTDAILSPTYTCPGTGGNTGVPAITCGDPTYEELDQKINGETPPSTTGGIAGCGDTSSSDNNGAGTQFAMLEIKGVTCNPTPCPPSAGQPAGTDCVSMPECTSWFQPTRNIPVCASEGPNTKPNDPYAWQPGAIPGTSSKCTCSTLFIPVQPIQPAVGVTKNCNIGTDPTPNLTTCHAGQEGNTVVYTVITANQTPSGQGGDVVDQICDDQYGTILASSTLSACAAGKLCTPQCTGTDIPFPGCTGPGTANPGTTCISSTTCSSTNPGDIPNGSSKSCTFSVNQGENTTVKDTVSVSGHSDIAVTPPPKFGPTGSNSVTVDSTDAPTTATTNLGYPANPLQNACVTVRYNVTVANTSAAEESVTLNSSTVNGITTPALKDGHFADITTTHGSSSQDGSVTATTCGSTAGTFPKTLGPGTCLGAGCPPTNNGGTYKCTFDGVICGTPTATVNPTCAAGLQFSDTGVVANLTGDDAAPNADTVSQTDSPFTTTICLIPE
jgi:hypothetical protein